MSNSDFAAAADAIDHSDDDDEETSESEEVSDISVAVSSKDNSDEDSDDCDDDSDDDDRDMEEAVFLRDARDIQNRTSQCVGMAAMEDRRFRSLFGACIAIIMKAWLMLWEERRASQSICSGRSIF
jgi:hypothetical protein